MGKLLGPVRLKLPTRPGRTELLAQGITLGYFGCKPVAL